MEKIMSGSPAISDTIKLERHGGEKGENEILYDFSVNLNPLGMPEAVKTAVAGQLSGMECYPDDSCRLLRNKIAGREGIPPEWILCGNGAADLIYRIAYGIRPKQALLTAPTFSEYERALDLTGCQIHYYDLKREDEFRLPADFTEQLTEQIGICFLCQPGNPVGNLIPREQLRKILKVCEENKILLILDECFLALTGYDNDYDMTEFLRDSSVLFILKAFTKTYAMAGLRLGYLMSSNLELLDKIKAAGAPWSVSVPAQLAGTAALEMEQEAYLKRAVKLIREERAYLVSGLEKIGYRIIPGVSNFILFEGRLGLYEELLKQKILIRRCGNYRNLDCGYYRIAVRSHEENMILLRAMKNI
ncbi:histidinol-phosphate transaminase [Anaerolentibacter hominis]|uniref:pyridoxal phosphate-dependent aminotransferase n=1 Tax=Anaerolentibacter hominis TaxID=3079009 RepID=UPI0031B81753